MTGDEAVRDVVRGVRQVRDLTVMDVGEGCLVVACDSVGGIGPKPDDTVSVPATTTAHFATRVPLLEVLCAGARPTLVVDTLCVELDPTGHDMITEVQALAAEVGLDPGRVTGTTEDNVPTRATGIGVTVIGESDGRLRPGTSRPSDVVLCLGEPHSAPADEVIVGGPRMVRIADLVRVLDTGAVRDALPVGSRGIGWEVAELARTATLETRWRDGHGVDVDRSGGPSTCVLVTCATADETTIRAALPATLAVVAVADLVAGPRGTDPRGTDPGGGR